MAKSVRYGAVTPLTGHHITNQLCLLCLESIVQLVVEGCSREQLGQSHVCLPVSHCLQHAHRTVLLIGKKGPKKRKGTKSNKKKTGRDAALAAPRVSLRRRWLCLTNGAKKATALLVQLTAYQVINKFPDYRPTHPSGRTSYLVQVQTECTTHQPTNPFRGQCTMP